MPKVLTGKVIANKMQNTLIVEVSRLVPHPLYKKRLTKSKKYKVESFGERIEIGQSIKIVETKPMSKDKHFAVLNGKKQAASPSKPKTETKPVVKTKAKTKKEKTK